MSSHASVSSGIGGTGREKEREREILSLCWLTRSYYWCGHCPLWVFQSEGNHSFSFKSKLASFSPLTRLINSPVGLHWQTNIWTALRKIGGNKYTRCIYWLSRSLGLYDITHNAAWFLSVRQSPVSASHCGVFGSSFVLRARCGSREWNVEIKSVRGRKRHGLLQKKKTWHEGKMGGDQRSWSCEVKRRRVPAVCSGAASSWTTLKHPHIGKILKNTETSHQAYWCYSHTGL